jgi:hypothetical protein
VGARPADDRADAVLALGRSLRAREHPQWGDAARSLAHPPRAPGDSPLSRDACARRRSTNGVHDARRRRGGGEPGHSVPGAQERRGARSMEYQALAKRHGVRAACSPARALARRHQLPESRRDILLFTISARFSTGRHASSCTGRCASG